jgi:phosphohistidine phosphatase
MDFYLIRHADAELLGEGGVTDDADRPLTAAGQAQCAALAGAFEKMKVQLDHLVSSPLLRARQTAEGLLQHWPAPAPALHPCEGLAPGGKRRKLTRFLRDLEGTAVGLVGHMPDLGIYAAWLIGSRKAQVEIAKAGVARIHFEGRPGKGQGVLNLVVTPECYPV